MWRSYDVHEDVMCDGMWCASKLSVMIIVYIGRMTRSQDQYVCCVLCRCDGWAWCGSGLFQWRHRPHLRSSTCVCMCGCCTRRARGAVRCDWMAVQNRYTMDMDVDVDVCGVWGASVLGSAIQLSHLHKRLILYLYTYIITPAQAAHLVSIHTCNHTCRHVLGYVGLYVLCADMCWRVCVYACVCVFIARVFVVRVYSVYLEQTETSGQVNYTSL